MINKKRIAGLILAAGYASRMGEIKPLLPIGSVTTLERVISSFFAGGIDNIYLILGHHQEEIKAHLPYINQINILYNPNYPTGMFSSLQLGINSIDDTIDAFLMTPADCPLIDSKTISDIKNCYENTQSDIICPVFDSKTGHPCLFSMKFKDDILNKELKNGLRSLIEENITLVKYIKSENPYINLDMDTKNDYEQILQKLKVMPSFWVTIAQNILMKEQTLKNIVDHGKAVAKLSQIIANALVDKGYNIDIDLLMASALLHDIKKAEKNHAIVGGEFITKLGYPTLGSIISSHMGNDLCNTNKITEKEILFFADKMIKDTSLVSISIRFSFSYEKFKDSDEITKKIKEKEKLALDIKHHIESIISEDLEEIIFKEYYE